MEADADLVERCKRGDRDAQSHLYVLTVERIYRLVLRTTGNPDDAFDITQDTYVKAFGALCDFRGQASIATWLFGIALNETRQFRRRAGREQRYLNLQGHCPDGKPSYEERTVVSIDVDAALAAVDVEDREVLLLRYDLSLSYRDIATVLRCREGTVASRLNRARARLRELLGEAYSPREELGSPKHPMEGKDTRPDRAAALPRPQAEPADG